MQRRITDWGGNILGLFVVIAVNGMANAIPIGGQTTGQISAKYESLFTPAGYAFSIWGLIYLGLLIYAIYQALPAQRQNVALASINKPFLLNCAANSVWIFAWHYDFVVVSLLLMFVILGTLISIYRKLGIANGPASRSRRLFVHLPFSIYTGWITVATIANISAVQTGLGWDAAGLSAIDWTLIKLAVAGAIAAIVVLRRGDVAYGLVVAWAGYGIVVKQGATAAVAGAAEAVVLVALFVISFQTWRKLRS